MLGFPTAEVAAMLDTSETAVKGAVARARAALACVSIGAAGAIDARPDICVSRPIGTTSTPPSTTGGNGEICASSFSSSSRFCSRACRRSARLRASPELSRALGLPACSWSWS